MIRYESMRAAHEGGPVTVFRTEGGSPVARLDPRYDLRDHSPGGFQWGYPGSGPTQLALAILADATNNDKLALALYQKFKFAFISGYPPERPLVIKREDVLSWVGQQTRGALARKS